MITRALRTILGVIILLCSTPSGMAKSSIPEGVRVCFFASDENAGHQYEVIKSSQEVLQADDDSSIRLDEVLWAASEAAIAGLENSSAESGSAESSMHRKDYQKRQQQLKEQCSARRVMQNRLSKCFCSKGTRGALLLQDALRQRTELIRYLHFKADID